MIRAVTCCLCGWLCLIGFAYAPALATTGGERTPFAPRSPFQTDTVTSPDLAALTLSPLDAGLDGFVHVGGFVGPLADEAASVAAYWGQGTQANEVAARLTGYGWQRKYVAGLMLPSESAPDRALTVVRSYVTEYADPNGAAEGFTYLEDERLIPGASDVPTTRLFGEQSELTRERGTSSDGQPFRSADLTFRIGSFVAGVTVIAHPGRDFADPDLATVEALGAILESRVQSPPAVGSTLGGAVLRLRDGEGPFVTLDDAYYRRNGGDVPIADETAQAAAARIHAYGTASDVYQLYQTIDAGGGPGVLASTTLYRFPSATAAETWLDSFIDLLAGNPYYGDPRLREVGAPLGDQTVTIDFVPRGISNDAPRAIIVAARIGTDVGRVQLAPNAGSPTVPLAAVEALARIQLDCLAAGSCPGPMTLPDDIATALTPATSPIPAASPGSS